MSPYRNNYVSGDFVLMYDQLCAGDILSLCMTNYGLEDFVLLCNQLCGGGILSPCTYGQLSGGDFVPLPNMFQGDIVRMHSQ